MRFYHLVLLVVAVLLATADSTSATTRSLRAHDDEERGISIPGLKNAVKSLTSSKTKLQGLIKADESLGNAFKTLGLSKIPIGKNDFIETKMVAKLFSSKDFKIWSRYAAQVNKQDPEGAMLAHLTNVFGEKNVATMIVLGKNSRSSKSVAKKLEAAQFNKWFATDKLNADQVLEKVMQVTRRNIHRNPREKWVWVDYSKYYTKRVEEW